MAFSFLLREIGSHSESGQERESNVIWLVLFIWFLNLGISIWNSVAVGRVWVESKHAGGGVFFMAWMGATMAALGFTWCYMVVLGVGLTAWGVFNEVQLQLFFNLGYLLLLPGFLFAGTAIMFQSWANAYRERTVKNYAVAGYNTFANAYNYYSAIRNVPAAWDGVLDAFGSMTKSKDGAKIVVVLVVLIIAFGLGILTTWLIVSRVAANDEPLPSGQPQFGNRLSRRYGQ